MPQLLKDSMETSSFQPRHPERVFCAKDDRTRKSYKDKGIYDKSEKSLPSSDDATETSNGDGALCSSEVTEVSDGDGATLS